MYYVGAVGFLATAIGFGFGGVLAIFFKKLQGKVSTINALCTGLIIGLVCLEIAPESIDLGGKIIFTVGVFVGILSFFKIHEFSHKFTISTENLQKDRLIQTGFLLAISITIHNFPLGIAFGASQNIGISKPILQALILHNIPEGIAMFIPLFLAGLRFKMFLLITSIVSLPVALGSIVGSLIGMKYPILWAFIISFALGIIVIVTIKEIFIEAVKQSSFGHALLFVGLGIFIIWGYMKFI
ncbi:ZIP family metal transporter [Rummeliibacillus pycnus]|uniref:ZIP family metal transporter n=1 Tax=Rummeliibacillus pycnus TaxID=101070 RepID=UPI001474D23B|nr:ZIP family metal transporter [Rummeliibacillus pycnus]